MKGRLSTVLASGRLSQAEQRQEEIPSGGQLIMISCYSLEQPTSYSLVDVTVLLSLFLPASVLHRTSVEINLCSFKSVNICFKTIVHLLHTALLFA